MFIEILSENYLFLFQSAPSTPVVYLLFTLFLIGVFVPLLLVAGIAVRWYQNKWLLINGEAAQAKILKIWETGAYVNEQPQVGMLLEVYAANRPVYQAEAKRIVSILNIPRIQVGSTVDVKFDPQNPSRIAVVL